MYATDDNYWMPTYVSIHSLLTNNRESEFQIYVVTEDVDSRFKGNVSAFDTVHQNYNIEFITVDNSQFKDLPEPNHLTKGIYYRLLAGSLLPVENENVLYIDCDTLIRGSLTELFETDMSGSVAAATPHYELVSYFYDLPIETRWYNTGVMYLNMSEWGNENIERKAMEYIRSGDIDGIPLQKILNSVLSEDNLWKPIGPEYNCMSNWLEPSREFNFALDPVIVHYAGGLKPWQYRTIRPYTDDWWGYLSQTPYADYKPPDKNLKNKVMRRLYALLHEHPNLRTTLRGVRDMVK